MKTEKLGSKPFPYEKLLAVAAVLITVGAFVPYLLTTRYALPWSDDFADYTASFSYGGNSALSRAALYALGLWTDMQGGFTSSFFNGLLNPLQFNNYSLVIRVELFGLLLASFAALALFLPALCGYCGLRKSCAAFLGCLFLLPLLSYEAYTGAYLWYTGAMAYLLPAVFLLPSLSLLLIAKNRGKPKLYILSGVLAFFMSGCSLEAAGLGNALFLLLFVLESIRARGLSRPFGAVFLSALAGALLNALAPGNFVRHSVQFGGGLNIWGAAVNSLRFTWQELSWLFGRTSFPVFVVLALLLGVYICRKIPRPALAVSLIGALVLPVITIFPVVLGYSWDGGSMANRSMFLFDASIIASALAIAILLGSQLSALGLLPERRLVCIAVCTLAAAGALLLGGGPGASKPVAIVENLRNGSIQHFSRQWRQIYDYVRDCGQGDVVVTIPAPEETTGCAVAGFTMNPDNWQNFTLAEYFGADSVRLSE